jgi:hypothetical protein
MEAEGLRKLTEKVSAMDASVTVKCHTRGLLFEGEEWKEGSNIPAEAVSIFFFERLCDLYFGGAAAPSDGAMLPARLGRAVAVSTEYRDRQVAYGDSAAKLNKAQRDFFLGYIALAASTDPAINRKKYRALLQRMGDRSRVIDRVRFLRKVLRSPPVVLAFLADSESFPLELLSSRRSKTEESDEAFEALCSDDTELYADIIEPLMDWVKARAAAVNKRQPGSVKKDGHAHTSRPVRVLPTPADNGTFQHPR